MTTPEPGNPAPNFQAKDQHGNTRSLSEFKGKNVVLYFYPKDDTPGCTKEACAFRDSMDRLENANTAVLGVSTDDVDSHHAFVEKYNLPFTLLADTDGEIVKAYNAGEGKAKRVTFLIGPDGKILQAYQKVDPSTHADQILEDLANLQTH